MKQRITWFVATMASIALTLAVLLMVGCSTTTTPKGGSADSPGAPMAASTPLAQKGGAELWGRNCGHCHNIRSPSSYSDAQWDVVMLHMRVRANLTPDEHKKILAFLKSAH